MDERIQVILEAKDLMSGEVRRITGHLEGFDKSQGRVKASTVALGTALGNLAHDAIRGAIGAISDAIGEVVEFERAMLNVNSIAKVGADDFAAMKDAVLDLSTVVPQSASTLAAGLYDIQSSGFAGKEGIEVLDAAAKAASAGLTTTASSAKGLTAILNAYGLGASSAGRISDIMFKTVDRGVISFDELATEIGKTTALAAPLGVEVEEVAGAIALMTRKGIDGANATTQLNAIMQTLLKPSKEAAELAGELGLGWDTTALKGKGLAGVLSDMIEKTGGNHEQMATLLGDARAIRGAFVLAADGGGEFTSEIEAMRQAAGATDTALSYQKQGLAYNLGILSNQLDAAVIKIGDKLLPVITELVQELSAWLRENDEVVEAVGDALLGVVEGLTFAIGLLVDGIKGTTPAATVAAAGMIVAFAPVVVPLAAIAATIAGISTAANFFALDFGEMGDRIHDIANRSKNDFTEVKDWIRGRMDETGQSFEDAARAAEIHFGAIPDTADRAFRALDKVASEHMLRVKGYITKEGEATAAGLAGALEEGTPEVEAAADALAAEIAQAAEDARKAAIDSIKGLMGELPGIFRSTDELEKALAELHEKINNPWDDTQRRSALEAALASEEIAAGLRSSDSAVVQDTIDFVNNLLEQYGTMAPGALAAGELVNPAMRGGLDANMRLVLDKAQEIASRTGSDLDFADIAAELGWKAMSDMAAAIRANDEAVGKAAAQAAERAKTALRMNATSWGAHLVDTFATGMESRAWRVSEVSLALAGMASRPLAFSEPPDIGPLSSIRSWGPHMVDEYAGGILRSARRAGEAGLAVADEAASAIASALPGGGPGIDVVGPAIAIGAQPFGGGSAGGAAGGGAPLAIHFNSTWPPTPAQAREIAELVQTHLYYGAQPDALGPRR